MFPEFQNALKENRFQDELPEKFTAIKELHTLQQAIAQKKSEALRNDMQVAELESSIEEFIKKIRPRKSISKHIEEILEQLQYFDLSYDVRLKSRGANRKKLELGFAKDYSISEKEGTYYWSPKIKMRNVRSKVKMG